MRLSQAEQSALTSVLAKFLRQYSGAKLFLFGSRADDSLKGGDIDLLVVIPKRFSCDKLKNEDYKIIAAIKANVAIGDQKIDLKIISEDEATDPFFESALKRAVPLYFT